MPLPVALRYTLIQIPELALFALLMLLLVQWQWVSYGVAIWLTVAWAVKDVALYPVYRHGLREAPPHGGAALVGRQAKVLEALLPQGQILVNGERWRARCRSTSNLSRGDTVRIVDADGLTLIVERVSSADALETVSKTRKR